jgi:large subunit ribosomal protein L18
MKRVDEKIRRRKRRKTRIRGRINGTADRPRISVFKSNRYLYAQAVNDEAGATLTSCSTVHGAGKGIKLTVEGAGKLGKIFGEELKSSGFKTAVFDRNGYLYHGVVKAFADGVRESGVTF